MNAVFVTQGNIQHLTFNAQHPRSGNAGNEVRGQNSEVRSRKGKSRKLKSEMMKAQALATRRFVSIVWPDVLLT